MKKWRVEPATEQLNIPLPDLAYRHNLSVGDSALCEFSFDGEHAKELMWVEVAMLTEGGYKGVLANEPKANEIETTGLKKGDVVEFGPEHVYRIWPKQE